jgi:hypothetical protein
MTMPEDPTQASPGASFPAGTAFPPAPGAAPEPTFGQRVLALVSAPRQAFVLPHRMAVWLIPMILMAMLAVTESVLLRDMGLEKAVAKIEHNDNIPQEQKDKILEQMRSPEANSRSEVLGPIFAVIGGAASLAVPALIYLLLLNFVLGGQTRFSHVLGVVCLSSLINLPREILRLPIILSKHTLEVYFSPAAFVGGDGGMAAKLLNRFDLFDLYRLFLLSVGFAVITQMPVKKTAVAVVSLWLLATLAMVGFYLSPLGRFAP